MSVMMAALLALAAGRRAKVNVQVCVKGMSCEVNCGQRSRRALAALPGAKDAKLTKFDDGLVHGRDRRQDRREALRDQEGRDRLRDREDRRDAQRHGRQGEGRVRADDGLRRQVHGVGRSKEECAKAVKPGETAACPIGALEKLVADAKTVVNVTGILDECCQGSMSIAALKVSAFCEATKPAPTRFESRQAPGGGSLPGLFFRLDSPFPDVRDTRKQGSGTNEDFPHGRAFHVDGRVTASAQVDQKRIDAAIKKGVEWLKTAPSPGHEHSKARRIPTS